MDAMFFKTLASRYTIATLPVVETARLRIDTLVPADADAVQAITNDPAITGAVDFLPTPFTLGHARSLIDRGKAIKDRFLAIRLPGAGLVGIIGIHLRGDQAVEIGYWIGGSARGQGHGSEAVDGVVGLLRKRFPHRIIVAECRPENVASVGLLRKVGFRDTGDEGHRPGRRIFVIEPR